ncbi:hypothetical protein RhiLY_11239 [Ceratobasidium sp. AG-Ba]|nr:hypothetical protein RhiLY_11239 [Ceratobasidium sp. AG-Ba]
MSQVLTTSSKQPEGFQAPIDPRLLDLLRNLRTLPTSLSDHPGIYPFPKLTIDAHDAQHYGSPQAALVHRLELIFGERNTSQMVRFRGRGPSLGAVVYTFSKYIDGEHGDNKLLWSWVHHLTKSAIKQSKSILSKSKVIPKKSRYHKTGKRNGPQPRTKRSEAEVRAKKQASAIRYPHDPNDLEDDPPDDEPGSGRSRDELLDRLAAPMRMVLGGAPNRSPSPERSASLSLASKLKAAEYDGETEVLPVINAQQREDTINHALLKFLCDRMIAPSAVDCSRWREFIEAIDPSVHTASASTIADSFVTTEAAYIHEASVRELSQHDHLTLSYDGGTTRKHESVYTVHITNPATREAHIMEGNEASGVSHTAEHICSVIDKALKEVGPEHLAAIVSDNAGNTRAARSLMQQEYPWIITLQDACHQLNNAAKDVGQLNYFQECIDQLRSIIKHFHSSSYAARHLAALRVAYHIAEGLVAIGLTRFASIYYAAYSTLKCLPLIRELISSGVLDTNAASPLYWMVDRNAVWKFQEQLAQLVAVLEPFARAIKCLESSHSTLSDVQYLELDYQKMFQKASGQVYLADFFLDIRYRSSDILARRTIQSAAENQNNQHIPSNADLLPDRDLRKALPAYTMAGDYLVKLLAHVYNKDPDASLFARYASWSQIETSFRNQLILFTRGLRPFHQVPKPSTEQAYWDSMSSVPAAELLAHLGTILTSVVPNSMAEERSMSTVTKLNSPDRAAQKVSTLIDMVAIRQHYKREENRESSKLRAFRPTVRFADLSQVIIATNSTNKESKIDTNGVSAVLRELDNDLTSGHDDVELSTAAKGSLHHFEVELSDGISLSSKLLSSLISDDPATVIKRSSSPEPPATVVQSAQKRQRVDVSTVVY